MDYGSIYEVPKQAELSCGDYGNQNNGCFW